MESGLEVKTEPASNTAGGGIVFDNLVRDAIDPGRNWQPFREGVEISELYAVDNGMASAFLRFSPGARLPRHCHAGHEHIFVLRGSQQDENGVHRAGAMLLHPPGTCHNVSSPEGCIVLAIWGKPVTF